MSRKPGERIKTNLRDALTLARHLRAAKLTPVAIPDTRDEAIRELSRFAHAKQLMSYCGLEPSENSTGESRVQGKLIKTGNAHVRRVLIEST